MDLIFESHIPIILTAGPRMLSWRFKDNFLGDPSNLKNEQNCYWTASWGGADTYPKKKLGRKTHFRSYTCDEKNIHDAFASFHTAWKLERFGKWKMFRDFHPENLWGAPFLFMSFFSAT